MKRMLLALAVAGGLSVSTLAAAEEDVKPLPAARLVSIEVALAEFDATLWPAQDPAAGGKLLEALRAAEGQEKVYSFTQVRLSALENQQAMAQWAERVAVPAGRTISSSAAARVGLGGGGSGGFPQATSTSYSRESLGTTISATCRVDESGLIVIELNLEQSRLAADTEVKLDASDPDASVLLKPVTKTLKTVVSIADGQTIVIGGMTTKTGKQHRQDAILVTARIIGSTPVKSAARSLEPPTKAVAAASPVPTPDRVPAAAPGSSPDRFRQTAERMIQQFDRNSNGVLDLAEMTASALPKNADQDGDGRVTVDELAKALPTWR